MPGWASDINFQPLTPPASASLDGKWMDYGFPSFPTNSGFPGLSTPNARSQFGQITPPSDENDVKLSLEQDLHDQPELSTSPQAESSAFTGQKRTRGKSGKEPTAKRSRKYGSRNGDTKTGKTEDVRRSKFLERNRVAASKCRQKKKEWTQNLETRAREMQKNSGLLRMAVDSLRDEVLFLKGELLKHHSCECTEIQKFMKSHGNNLALQQDHDRESVAADPKLKREDASASPRLDSDLDESSSLAEDELTAAERRSIADDDSALEALLTKSINQDNDDAMSVVGDD